MIPIRDTAPRYRFPIINIGLILLNVYIFIQQLTLPPEQLYCFIYTYGTVPANLTGPRAVSYKKALGYNVAKEEKNK